MHFIQSLVEGSTEYTADISQAQVLSLGLLSYMPASNSHLMIDIRYSLMQLLLLLTGFQLLFELYKLPEDCSHYKDIVWKMIFLLDLLIIPKLRD